MSEQVVSESSLDLFSAFATGGPVGIFVMVLLVVLSLATWYVIFERWFTLGKFQKKSQNFIRTFWDAKSLSDLYNSTKDIDYSPAREVFRSGYNEMVRLIQTREKRAMTGAIPFDTVKRALSKAKGFEDAALARNLGFLAVAASACPFIGLFGTVIGIIRAFQDIGRVGSTSLAAVAPGISEALIATALGLAAAIPAVVFYNIFSGKLKQHLLILDGFSADFLNIIERHYNCGRPNEHHAD